MATLRWTGLGGSTVSPSDSGTLTSVSAVTQLLTGADTAALTEASAVQAMAPIAGVDSAALADSAALVATTAVKFRWTGLGGRTVTPSDAGSLTEASLVVPVLTVTGTDSGGLIGETHTLGTSALFRWTGLGGSANGAGTAKFRWTRLQAKVVPASGSAAFRLTRLGGRSVVAPTLVVTLTGQSSAEPLETVTLTAACPGATSFAFAQVAGPAVALTATGNAVSFTAPILDGATQTVFIAVTASAPGTADATVNHSVVIYPVTEYTLLASGVWDPRVRVVL